MNIVDSSCWLEYLAGTKVGEESAKAIEDLEHLIVPSITIYEVFKKILAEVDEDKALLVIAHMKQGQVIDLDADLAAFAVQIGREFKLPMADSILYATARRHEAIIWTQDKHFKDLQLVKYFGKIQD